MKLKSLNFFLVIFPTLLVWNTQAVFADSDIKFDLPEHSSSLEWQLSKLAFSGNLGCERSEFLKNLRTKPKSKFLFWRKHSLVNKEIFLDDLQRMRRLLELQGYYSSNIAWKWTSFEKVRKVELNWQIEAGDKLKVEDIVLNLPENFELNQNDLMAVLPLNDGDDFSEKLFQDSYQTLMSYFLTRGYLWVNIEPQSQVSLKQKLVKIRFKINPGPIALIGETLTRGNLNVKKNLIEREFVHTEGEVFNTYKLNQSRSNLLQTRWFKSVVLGFDPEVKKGSKIVPVILDIKEAEPRSIGLGFGFGSDQGVHGKARWQHRNWLGRGWKNTTEIQASTLELNASVRLDIPHFKKSNADLGLWGQYGRENEDDYTLLLGSIGADYSLALSKESSLKLQWEIKKQDHDSDSSLLLSLGNPPESSVLMGPGIKWSREWENARFINAFSLSSATEVLEAVDSSKAGFWRHKMSNRSRVDLKWGWSLHQNYSMGWMRGWGKRGIPVSDRFYLGGSGSVRGFSRRALGPRNMSEDILGGKSFAAYSLEMQHEVIIQDLIGAIFIDGGQLDLKSYGWQLNGFRHAIGAGIGYRMPIGLIRLDVGFPLKRMSWDNAFQIHFDLGIRL
jgi:outer membrane protein assembly complex protein YaeT